MTTTDLPVRQRRRRRESIEAIVGRHRPLALRLARRFQRPGCSPEQLEHAASSALGAAARCWDVRNSGFAAFAVAAILAELRRQRPTPIARVLADPLVRSAVDAFVASRGRHPTAREVARVLGWTVEDVVEARLAASQSR